MQTTIEGLNKEASLYHAKVKHIVLSGNRHLMQWWCGCGDGSYTAFTCGEVYKSLNEAVRNESFLWEMVKMGIKMFKTDLYKYIAGDMLVVSGKDIKMSISHVQVEKLPDSNGREQDKYILYFEGQKKGMVLNKTNVKTIIGIVGSDDTDDWAGVPVLLTTEPVKAFGKEFNALRIKEVKGWRRAMKQKEQSEVIAENVGGEPEPLDVEGTNALLFPASDTAPTGNNYGQ